MLISNYNELVVKREGEKFDFKYSNLYTFIYIILCLLTQLSESKKYLYINN